MYPTAPSNAAPEGTVVTLGIDAVNIVPLINPVSALNDNDVAASTVGNTAAPNTAVATTAHEATRYERAILWKERGEAGACDNE